MQQITIAQANIANLTHELMLMGSQFRACKRKAYNIFACVLPEGVVYANKLEQPLSYDMIITKFHRPFITVQEAESCGATQFLQTNGCYITKPGGVTLCGTQGELWQVKSEKFLSSYTNALKDQPKPGVWFSAARGANSALEEIGIQVPNNLVVTIDMGWGIVNMNDPRSPGHHKGDILVFAAKNNRPDYSKSFSPINNSVFALTFNQSIGGWASSNLVVSAEEAARDTPTFQQLMSLTEQFRTQ